MRNKSLVGTIFSHVHTWEKSLCQMQIFGLNETIDYLATTSSVHWYGHVLRREDGDVLSRALELRLRIKRGIL